MSDSKRINLTLTAREYNTLLEVRERIYNRLRLTTVVKNLALDRAEELIAQNENNGKFKQLDLLKDK